MPSFAASIRGIALFSLLAIVGGAQDPALAQEADNPLSRAAAARIERERVRQTVEDSLDRFYRPAENAGLQNQQLVEASTDLVELGDDVLPFLLNELDAENRVTFTFTAYTLGRLGHPDAIPALHKAIRRSREEDGDFAVAKRTWSAYALGMLGDPSGLEVMSSGNPQDIAETVHFRTTILEAASYLAAPASVEPLHEMWRTWNDDDERRDKRITVIAALGRIGDPRSLPIVLEAMQDSNVAIRREASIALLNFEDPSVPEAWETMLFEDADFTARWSAGKALLRAGRTVPVERVSERLAAEPDSHVRGQLYHLLARSGGKSALPRLQQEWGLPDPVDRLAWVDAVGSLGTVRAVEPLSQALADRDVRIARATMAQLGKLGSKRSLELLRAQIASEDWTRARGAIEELTRLGDAESAAAIADRLIDREMKGIVLDAQQRERLVFLAEALVDLAYLPVLERLREPAARQQDGTLKSYLPGLIGRVEALREFGGKPKKLAALLGSEVDGMPALAVQALRAIANPEAVQTLVSGFEKLSSEDQAVAVQRFRDLDLPGVRAWIVRLLDDPAWDGIEAARVRAEAAWAARRLGGPELVDALNRSALRRDGQDPFTLYALALIAAEAAIPTLERVRIPRLHYLKATRGTEQNFLDFALHQLRHGGSLAEIDREPGDWDFFLPY